MANFDFMVRSNSASGASLTTSELDLPYADLEDSQGSSISYSAGTFTLGDAGHYLVSHSSHWTTTNTTNNQRFCWDSYLRVNGANILEGEGSGYIRKSSGHQDDISFGHTIIETSGASQSLLVRAARHDSSTTGTCTRVGNREYISILKLDNDGDYARYVTTSNKTISTGNGTETTLVWDSNDEQDTGFSRSGATITISDAGRYVMLYTIPINITAGGTARHEYSIWLELDAVLVPGSHITTYPRNRDGITDYTGSWGGIINVAANDDLTLIVRRNDGETGAANVQSGASIQLWKLPSAAETVIVETATGNYNTAATDFSWDDVTPAHIDTDSFTYSGPDTNIDVDVTDAYLAFATQGTPTAVAATRAGPAMQFRVNTTNTEIGAAVYHRNSGGADKSGMCIGGVLDLTANDSVIVRNDRIGTASTAIACASGQFSMLRLGTLTATGPDITNFGDELHYDGEQSLTITGTDFGTDTALAKVEVGDSSVYASATKVELDTAGTWNATTITVNMEAETSGNSLASTYGSLFKTFYLFVTDSAGSTSSGYPFQLTTEPDLALNTDATDLEVDTTYILLCRVQVTVGEGTTTYRWAYNHDSGGDTPVTGASSNIRAVASAALTNDQDIEEFLTGTGTYISNNDAGSEDGTFTLPSAPAAGESFVAALAFQARSVDVADNETGWIRIEENDGTNFDTYTQTFDYTINEPAAGPTETLGGLHHIGEGIGDTGVQVVPQTLHTIEQGIAS